MVNSMLALLDVRQADLDDLAEEIQGMRLRNPGRQQRYTNLLQSTAEDLQGIVEVQGRARELIGLEETTVKQLAGLEVELSTQHQDLLRLKQELEETERLVMII
jgi:hypothetical protein